MGEATPASQAEDYVAELRRSVAGRADERADGIRSALGATRPLLQLIRWQEERLSRLQEQVEDLVQELGAVLDAPWHQDASGTWCVACGEDAKLRAEEAMGRAADFLKELEDPCG